MQLAAVRVHALPAIGNSLSGLDQRLFRFATDWLL
jgi:hypothetical protein